MLDTSHVPSSFDKHPEMETVFALLHSTALHRLFTFDLSHHLLNQIMLSLIIQTLHWKGGSGWSYLLYERALPLLLHLLVMPTHTFTISVKSTTISGKEKNKSKNFKCQ